MTSDTTSTSARTRRGWRRWITGLTVLLFAQVAAPLPTAEPASAEGGSYSLDWSAADAQVNSGPYSATYEKVSPSALACPTPSGSAGRASDPLANAVFGDPKDAVESLAPPSMALGQIVPFEVQISVSGSTAPEDGVIQFSPYWLTKTTSGDDFGYDPSYEIYCAFVDAVDTASVDPAANAKVDSWTDWVADVGTSNEQIRGAIQVSGLDNGDSVIVEIWVVLKSTIPAGTSGNVQSGLLGAQTASGATINTGNQTVPLLKSQQFFTAEADVSIVKSDNPDPVDQGGQLTYSLVVTNNSTSTVANGVVVTDTLDANTTFVSGSWSGGTCTAAGVVVTCNVGALSPLQSVTISVTVNVSATAPTEITTGSASVTGPCTPGSADLCNNVSVSAITSDPNTANNSASEPTNVLGQPGLTLVKTATPATYDAVGDAISYDYVLTNSGTATLAGPFTVTDDKATVTCPATASLAVGDSITCTATYTIGQPDVDAGFVTNIAQAHGYYGSTPVDSNEDTETVTAVTSGAIDVEKYVSVDGGQTWLDADVAPGPELLLGSDPQFKFVVTNTGNVTLTGISLIDSDFDLSSCTIPGSLAPAASFECAVTAPWAASQHTNTGTASGSYAGSQFSDTDDANYFGAAPAIDIQKTPDTQTVLYGGTANFTIVVTNTGNVPLSNVTVTDPLAPTCSASIGDLAIAAVRQYTCTVANVTTPFTNVATVTGNYGAVPVSDSDDAAVLVDFLPTVDLTKDVSPTTRPEPGGAFTYTLTITNTSTEAVTITALTDTNPLPAACTGLIGQSIPAGGSLSCTYQMTQTQAGSYPNTANVTVVDSTGNPASDTDDATVTVTDVLPDISVSKTANPTSVPETGGNVAFTFLVTNHSVEAVTITGLADSVYGALAGDSDCQVGTVLAVGASCEFSITKWVEGDHSGPDHVNVFKAEAVDNDGNSDSATDHAVVDFADVLPDISVTKTANPTTVPETGAEVTFTFVVTNNGPETGTITSLDDSVYGTLAGDDDCKVGTILESGKSCEFSITRWVAGEYSGPDHVNVFTAITTDNEGNTDTATDDATVAFADVEEAVVTLPVTGSDSKLLVQIALGMLFVGPLLVILAALKLRDERLARRRRA